MNRRFLRPALALACLCLTASAAAAQQQPQRRRGGGLDNLSLPSTMERLSAKKEAAAADGWQTFAPEGEGFSVSMPGRPADATKDARERSYRLKVDGIEFEVTRTAHIPEEIFNMRGFREGFLSSLEVSLPASARREWPHMNLRLAGQRPAPLDGFDGREFDLESADYRSRVRAFVLGRSLLLVAMTGTKPTFTDEKAEKFFGSLRLTAP